MYKILNIVVVIFFMVTLTVTNANEKNLSVENQPIYIDNSFIKNSTLSDISNQFKKNNVFSNALVDTNYDFSKIKKICITNIDISNIDTNIDTNFDTTVLHKKIENSLKKNLKMDAVDKTSTDVGVDVIIYEWKWIFSKEYPESISYQGYETYYVWESEIESDFPRRYKKVRKEKQKLRTSSSPFPGSHKVVTPAYRTYDSRVTATINFRDIKDNKIILSCNGSTIVNRKNRFSQIVAYDVICDSFCENYKEMVKQKLYKPNADFEKAGK